MEYLAILLIPLFFGFATSSGDSWQTTLCNISLFGTSDVLRCNELQDTFILKEGNNITIDLDDTSDTITISASGVGGGNNTIPNPIVIIKTADETIISDNTYSNDDTLFFEAEANTIYKADLFIIFQSGTVPDFKYIFTTPSGGSATRLSGVLTSTSNPMPPISLEGQALSGNDALLGLTIPVVFDIGTGGTVNFQWAQNTNNASPTTVAKGSSMIIYKAT